MGCSILVLLLALSRLLPPLLPFKSHCQCSNLHGLLRTPPILIGITSKTCKRLNAHTFNSNFSQDFGHCRAFSAFLVLLFDREHGYVQIERNVRQVVPWTKPKSKLNVVGNQPASMKLVKISEIRNVNGKRHLCLRDNRINSGRRMGEM